VVPRVGVEPARRYGQRILSLLRGYSQIRPRLKVPMSLWSALAICAATAQQFG
jgi:hypothetical protein